MGTINAAQVIKLKRHIASIVDFAFITPDICPYRFHIGAILADAILQAGLNYTNTVFPRILTILRRFPDAVTLHDFAKIIDTYGTEDILQLRNIEKSERLRSLIKLLQINRIDTVDDLADFVSHPENIKKIKNIKGIGYKTCDYLLILLGFDVVAVDRHIKAFLKDASIDEEDYIDIQLIVSYAADMMGISRRCLDYSIWHYKSRGVIQRSLFEFDDFFGIVTQ